MNVVDFKNISFKIAWAVTTHDDVMAPRSNVSFVQWQPIIRSYDGMTNTRQNVGFHLCTPEDLDSFDPIDPSNTDVLSHFRSTPTLNCLDKDV